MTLTFSGCHTAFQLKVWLASDSTVSPLPSAFRDFPAPGSEGDVSLISRARVVLDETLSPTMLVAP